LGERNDLRTWNLTFNQNIWFEEDDPSPIGVDQVIASARATFTVDQGTQAESVTKVFRPGWLTTLRVALEDDDFEGTTAEYKGSWNQNSSGDTGLIYLTKTNGAAAGGIEEAPRAGSQGVTYGPRAAAARADAPAYAGLRIYSVTADGTSFTVNGFNSTGFTLALASDDLLAPPSEDVEEAHFDPSVTFDEQYTAGAMTIGTVSGSGNVWAARGPSFDFWLSSWTYTTKPPNLPENGESVTVFPEEMEEGDEALWLNFQTDSYDGVSFLIVAHNTEPVATDDIDQTVLGVPITIDVLANDSDPDGDDLTIISVTQGTYGTVEIANNAVTYTPGSGFTGEDVFSYTIGDGFGGTATATVFLAIGQAQLAEGGPNTGGAVPQLTEADLRAAVAAALPQLSGVLGVSFDRAVFGQIEFRLADLHNGILGITHQQTIWLDRDAAGYGWYLDVSSASDRSFGAAGQGQERLASPA
jgi:hypothetical protein